MSGDAAKSLGGTLPAVGDVLAQKYRVESVVGRGGMGVVVAARHVQLGQAVAIKLLTMPVDEDRRDEAIARFLNEAQAAARLQSDHVVRIYDVGQLDGGLPFMVMELLVGVDLGTLLDQRGQLPEAEAADYVLQACAGVAEAHGMGIVHRDLKPANLFVTRRSDGLPLLKVLDFGISKQLTDPGSGERLPTFTNTRTLMGSPNYMSPEQIRDARRVDARADIWALGIILQELLTNAPVFQGESFPGVCAAIVADPPLPVRTLRPDVSPSLEAVIERCLQKDVTKRYQSVAELAAALSPLGVRATGSGSGPQAVVYSSHARVAAGAKVSSGAALPAPNDDHTIEMPSGPSLTLHGPDRTMQSARLATRGSAPSHHNTHSALSTPDSRIEVRELPPRRSKLVRYLAPSALLALLVGAAAWWQTQPRRASTSLTASGQAPTAPRSRSDASFLLSIDSEPTGASVSEGSARLGMTPLSLELDLPEGATPRVFVVEKDGYQPYVVRQGAARGSGRVVASLSPEAKAPAEPSPLPLPSGTAPAKAHRVAAPKPKPKPVPPPDKPPSDIRLER
ncbi:MAG: PEGA domain-containing protein [Myxococcales bacterium]|nr:MAG: PEGA domain-containing protein [Myxococcales bacterium]